MIDAGLVVNGLRFLLDVYKLASEKLGGGRKDDPDPAKLEEVIADVQASATDGPPDPAQVEQEIDRKFSPEQAQKIKSDLTAFALLADPPKLEEFDYWTALVQIAKSLQAVAKKTELFVLRGQSSGVARYLFLKKTSELFVPLDVVTASLPVPNRAYGSEITELIVGLFEPDSEIPVKVGVEGRLKRATSMGERFQERVADTFTISAGTERNRLRLTPNNNIGDFVAVEYRVKASQIAKVVEAMQSDVSDYLEEIAKERDSARDLAQNVNAMVKDLSDRLH